MSTGRTPRRLFALALACSAHAATPLLASPTVQLDPAPLDLAAAQTRAQSLAADGRLVHAHALLLDALDGGRGTDAERAQAVVSLQKLRERMASADREEIALQQADLALSRGNLALAASRADSVLRSSEPGTALHDRAGALASQIEDRQLAMLPLVRDALAQAGRDLGAGRYAEAKGQLALVRRSGVDLDEHDSQRLSRMELRIADAERSQGRSFEPAAQAAAGAAQAGVVRPRQDGQEGQEAQGQDQPDAPEQDQPQADEPQGQPQADPADLFREARRQDTRANLSQADAAFERGELAEARRLYEIVRGNAELLTPEERQRVTERLDEINVRLAGGPGAGPDRQVGAERELVRQNALAEFNAGVAEAESLLSQGDLAGARTQVERTRLRFLESREVFSQPEVDERLSRLDALSGRIADEAQASAERQARQLEQRTREEIEQRNREQRNERQRLIDELLDQAREFQKDMRYQEALDTIEQLLVIDPINPSGLLLRDAYEHILLYIEYNDIRRQRSNALAKFSVENERAIIPPLDVMNYPENWPTISQQREAQADFVDKPANRRVLAQLEETNVPVDLQDNPLEDALAFIATNAEVDIDVDWNELDRIGIDRSTPVTIRLSSSVNAVTALDRVLAKASRDFDQADWAVIDGLLTVSSETALLSETAVGIYDINDLLHTIPEYDDVPEIDLDQALQSGGGGGGGGGGGQSPFEDTDEDEEDEIPLEDRIDEIIEIIENNIEDDRGFIEGLWTITPYRGLLIIRATPKAHRQIGGLLDSLRAQQALQIGVETRFLLVNQDFFEQIGFDLDVYFNANNEQVRAAREGGPLGPGDPTILGSDFFDFTGGGGLLRDVRGGGVIPGPGGFSNASASQGVVAPQGGFSPIGFGQNSLGLAGLLAPSEGFSADILGAAPALGIAGQFLDDVQVDFLVRATQADRRSTQLTAPRLTLTNGQIANISVATQVAFVGDLTPVVSDSAVGFDPTVNVTTEGVTLLVRGTISSDRRYVTMNVEAGLSQIDGFGTETITAVAGGTLVSSADTSSFIQLPIVTVTSVQTTVTVPDEGTILLGGQRLVNEFEVETGVPLLSKLPVLNRFFTNRIESKEEQTLLVLVKPTVLIQSEQEERSFPGLQDDLRRGDSLSIGF